MKTREQLDRIFYPRSLAVVGTNRVKGTVPYDILYNILKDGFTGTVFPVSPCEKSIAGVKAYKYVVDIEDEVDLAVLVFPSSVAHLAMEQLGQKGIKAAVIISAGFREVGQDGVERERVIKQIADRYGISFIGPNCLGVINTDPACSLNASFARKMPEEGHIAFISQSGALCTAVLDYARAKHIGFSKFVSFGNKADVSEIDLLAYLRDDPKTKVILLYLEEITDGRALMEAAREIVYGAGKPLLILKAGRTAEGARAAASHTGSLAGSDEICDAAFRQAGIIRADTIDDLFNFAIGMAYEPLPKSNRIAVVTNAGGPGVLATDMAVREGLSLARFTEETEKKLKRDLPPMANTKNPVDVIGDAHADRYRAALTTVLDDPDPAGIMVILTPQSMTDIDAIALEVSSIAEASEKPVYASFMGEADVSVGVEILQKRLIPHYQWPEDMCKAMARANLFRTIRERTPGKPSVFDDIRTEEARGILARSGAGAGGAGGRRHLLEADALRLLGAYGLPVPRWAVAASADEAAARAVELGFPVAVKVHSPEILHKSDVGGVVLDVQDALSARRAYELIAGRMGGRSDVILTPMVRGGEEIILGLKRDESFGPVLLFGLGGIFVEIFHDAVFRVAPVDARGAEEMIREMRSYPILAGARGRSGADLECLRSCLERLSLLAMELPEIAELDINPLIALEKGKGCVVTDAKIITTGG